MTDMSVTDNIFIRCPQTVLGGIEHMLIEAPRSAEILGSVKIYDVQKVLKLESEGVNDTLLHSISTEEIESVLERMLIVIPVKDEKTNLLDGVLRAIPKKCHVAVVSNSTRMGKNIFKMEEEIIKRFHKLTKHPIMLIHQKDPALGLAFKETGYPHIIDEEGLVRDGKAEGMITGLALAKAFGKDYVGFIDADNYFPGAVNEYIKDYAAGFCMCESPYTMVRLHWRHKPKIVKRKLYFKKWGRVSETTNRYLNSLLTYQTGFGTDIIKTGNAGEHAMTMELANIMHYSTGYSVEPYQYIYLLEEFGKGESRYTEASTTGIEVLQIETLNPHLHEEKGEKHVKGMLLDSLSTIYHSKLSNRELKNQIKEELTSHKIIEAGDDIKKNECMPEIENIDGNKFMEVLEENSETAFNFVWGLVSSEI